MAKTRLGIVGPFIRSEMFAGQNWHFKHMVWLLLELFAGLNLPSEVIAEVKRALDNIAGVKQHYNLLNVLIELALRSHRQSERTLGKNHIASETALGNNFGS